MSALPKYRKDMDEEESAPLYKNDQFVLEDTDEAVPSYPPRVGQCSAGPASEQNNVKYTFVPRWPIEGDVQNALGVLGRTKEVSRLSSNLSSSCSTPRPLLSKATWNLAT